MGRRIGTFGLVNYRTHPSDNRYKVFSFNSQEEADLFEHHLNEFNVKFEKDTEPVEGQTLYLFAVAEIDFSKARRANYLVSAKHRKPMIKNIFLRYALVLFVLGAIVLGIIGYVKQLEKLQNRSKEIEQIDVNS